MKKRLFAALCSLGLLPMGGCGSTLLSMQDAETMLESVYPFDFTYVDEAETTAEDGSTAMLYTFRDPAGNETQFLTQTIQTDDGKTVVGQSDRTRKALIASAPQWNALCDASEITYVQEDAVWRLMLDDADTPQALATESYQAAELIRAMLDSAPLMEVQTEGYVHEDVIEVYFQTTENGAAQAVYLCGFDLARQGTYTIDYIAGDIQLWMRQNGIME